MNAPGCLGFFSLCSKIGFFGLGWGFGVVIALIDEVRKNLMFWIYIKTNIVSYRMWKKIYIIFR